MGRDDRKTFVIGDVHACFDEFLNLLKKIEYKKTKHRLILVGDIINRGPYSLKMLEWVRDHQIEMVRGNHEQIFIEKAYSDDLSPSLKKLKQDMEGKLEDHLAWLSKLPFYIEEKDFIVVHAGIAPGQSVQNCKPHLLMNIRTWDGKGEDIQSLDQPAWHELYQEKKLVLYGHWAKQGLKVKANSIGLDTGCVYGGQLSGILLAERRIVQVPALKKHCAT